MTRSSRGVRVRRNLLRCTSFRLTPDDGVSRGDGHAVFDESPRCESSSSPMGVRGVGSWAILRTLARPWRPDVHAAAISSGTPRGQAPAPADDARWRMELIDGLAIMCTADADGAAWSAMARVRPERSTSGVGREFVTARYLSNLSDAFHEGQCCRLNRVEERSRGWCYFFAWRRRRSCLDELTLGALGVHVAWIISALGALGASGWRCRRRLRRARGRCGSFSADACHSFRSSSDFGILELGSRVLDS